jgi:GT2 family glycosyltransferase
MINIAFLITCHNRKKKTIKCLDSLFNQKYIGNIKFKVFLVDDKSNDGTNEAIKTLFPLVKIIKGNGNLFWAGGTNLAWKKALKDKKKYDYFILLNDDVFLFNKALNMISQAIQSSNINNKSKKFIISFPTCSKNKKRTTGGINFIDNLFSCKFVPTLVFRKSELIKCDTFNGNCLLVPYDVVKKIGILDKYYRHRFADHDYGLNALTKGVQNFFYNDYIGICELGITKIDKKYKYKEYKEWFYFLKKNTSWWITKYMKFTLSIIIKNIFRID